MAILYKQWSPTVQMSYVVQGNIIEAKRVDDLIFIEISDSLAGGFRAKYRFRIPDSFLVDKYSGLKTFTKPVPKGLSKKPAKSSKSKVVAKKVTRKVVKK